MGSFFLVCTIVAVYIWYDNVTRWDSYHQCKCGKLFSLMTLNCLNCGRCWLNTKIVTARRVFPQKLFKPSTWHLKSYMEISDD